MLILFFGGGLVSLSSICAPVPSFTPRTLIRGGVTAKCVVFLLGLFRWAPFSPFRPPPGFSPNTFSIVNEDKVGLFTGGLAPSENSCRGDFYTRPE